jgi:hypothetical protein
MRLQAIGEESFIGKPPQGLRSAPRQRNDSRFCLTFCHASLYLNPTRCNRLRLIISVPYFFMATMTTVCV